MARAPKKSVSAKPAKPAAAEEAPVPELPPAAPKDLSKILDWSVAELLDHVGTDRTKMLEELEAWKARHPGQAPLAQTVINLVQQYLSAAELQKAANAVAVGLTQLVFEGKGPVQHSGAELV